jgi:hypothetical protein
MSGQASHEKVYRKCPKGNKKFTEESVMVYGDLPLTKSIASSPSFSFVANHAI